MAQNAEAIVRHPDLFEQLQQPIKEKAPPFLKSIINRLLNITEIENLYRQIQTQNEQRHICDRLLECLGVSFRVIDEDLSRIPEQGPLLVVANHPFGAIEGLVLGSLLRSVRPDAKILANSLLRPIPELKDSFIWVDPFGGKDATHRNYQPLRESVRWLDQGGVLAAFPAGEVSHFQYDRKAITDPSWKDTIARIARKMSIPVLTVYFSGMNSKTFQLLGLLHPGMRTAMLIQEMLNKRNRTLEVSIGRPISPVRLRNFRSHADATEFLRMKTYLLGQRRKAPAVPSFKDIDPRRTATCIRPIAAADDAEILEREIQNLGLDHILCEQGSLLVLHADAQEIPRTLREIGRQREIAFRQAGEATGRELDLDRFDQQYRHIFLWDKLKQEIVGAYRLGHTDRILSQSGINGLYVHSLFPLSRTFFNKYGPALELGRSFIRRDHQRDGRSLPLLWMGIARYVAKQQKYRYLYGPVSISASYRPISRQLMAWFLHDNHASKAGLRPSSLKPPAFGVPDKRAACRCGRNIQTLDDLSDLISDVEPDSKGVPVLVRHYLRLGAKVLAFNIDPDFGNCLDALVVVDLAGVNIRILERLMGKSASADFLRRHGCDVSEPDICAAPTHGLENA